MRRIEKVKTGSREAFEARMRTEVGAGLARAPKELPSKYFYDERGSRLFERITEQPEYYLTRSERRLLEAHAGRWVRAIRPRTLIEPGAGSAAKTRILLDAMRAVGTAESYVPIDVSDRFLEETARSVRHMYPGLEVRPVVADIGIALDLPSSLPKPGLFAFLGSTIGNFEAADAIALLSRMRLCMRPADRLLLGVDPRKDVARIEAAYNDAEGLTAEFNRNILAVLNRVLGADFEPGAFEHRAFYNERLHRIEMWLVSGRQQEVHIPGMGTVRFAADEAVRTEISCKYDRESVDDLLTSARFKALEWTADADESFALALAEPV